jgi:hypothetical protein
MSVYIAHLPQGLKQSHLSHGHHYLIYLTLIIFIIADQKSYGSNSLFHLQTRNLVPYTLNAVKADARTFTKELKYSKLPLDLSTLQLTALQ